jgi:hypothetical protein
MKFKKTDKIMISPDIIIDTIELFLPFYSGDIPNRLDWILGYNIWSYNVGDDDLDLIYQKWNYLPKEHNLYSIGFLVANIRVEFDYIIDNFIIHPYDDKFHNDINYLFGRRSNMKINREYYSIIKSVDLLTEDGRYNFIYTDDFLNSKKSESIRRWLSSKGRLEINTLKKEIHFYLSQNDIIIDGEIKVDLDPKKFIF